MANYLLGALETVPALSRLDLLAPSTADFLRGFAAADRVGVVEIDPELSDTAATRDAYALAPEALVNCVIVAGKREGVERIAACLVPFTKRVDVNNAVKRRLDVRKASFLPQDRATGLSAMEFGGITPLGLPWPMLLDEAVAELPLALIGSGIRKSKLILPGDLLARLPQAELLAGLGVRISS